MDLSQPILRRSRRRKAADSSLSRFVDPQAENGQVTTNASRVAESVSTPQEPPKTLEPSSAESLTSESARHANGDHDRESLPDIIPSQRPSDDPLILSDSASRQAHFGPDTLLDSITTRIDSARHHHNPITYKRRRSMRTRSIPVDEYTSSPRVQLHSQRNTPTPTPSCSPIPIHASTRARKRRRRQAPLKNRLARVTRSRLARQRSQEVYSQTPAPTPAPPELVEEVKLGIIEPNVTQRRLAVPENYTIPDLKDLLNSGPHASQEQARPSNPVIRHHPAPRFVLPPRNTIHAPRLVHESKSPRARRKGDAPRLNFVALEAHQEQATMRSGDRRGSSVFGIRRLPLTQQTSPSRKLFAHKPDESDEIPCPIESYSNKSPVRSPCRVLVKDTPEPDQTGVPTPPNFAGAGHLSAGIEVGASRMNAAAMLPIQSSSSPNARPLAPMSQLYDNLLKLARSAEQMGKPIFRNVPEPSNLKRKQQTTLTPHFTFETTQPTKIPRLR